MTIDQPLGNTAFNYSADRGWDKSHEPVVDNIYYIIINNRQQHHRKIKYSG